MTRLHLIRVADLILTLSHYSREDLIHALSIPSDRVVVIGGAPSPYFTLAQPADQPGSIVKSAFPQLAQLFVLCVSGGDDRKNTEGLLTAWASLPAATRRNHQLVVTCKLDPRTRDRWLSAATALGLREEDVLFTDYISDELLRALYQTAQLLVLPSLDEGFGLPVAEAIACGCPALTSDTTSLPEILEMPQSTFPPTDTTRMSQLINRALNDEAFRSTLKDVATKRASLNSWELVAERTMQAVDRLPQVSPARRSTRRRVALVTPLPPTTSGVAEVSARLIPHLATRCDLDVFIPSPRPTPRGDARYRILPIQVLGASIDPAAYDAVVYVIGNSDDHHNTYETALRHPGILWFHDVRLDGLYWSYAESHSRHGVRTFMRDVLPRMYGPRVPARAVRDYQPTDSVRFGLGFTSELVKSARAVIVSSVLAEQLLRLDQGPEAWLPPVFELPLAVQQVRRFPDLVDSQTPDVVSFGVLAPVKQPDVIIRALPLIRRHVPARLAFVGMVWHPLEPLVKLASDLGVSDYVTFTGELDGPQYAEWLRRAAVAVQLRRTTNGESSAAVLDCLGSGIPVITNVLGSAQDLGEAIVTLRPGDVSPAEVAEAVVRILNDPAALKAQAERGNDYARMHTYDRMADKFISVIEAALHLGQPAPLQS